MYDSPSLRILAGLTKAEGTSDIKVYLNKAMKELEVPHPTREDSAWLLIEYWVDKIIHREIDPVKGVVLIQRDIYDKMEWLHENVFPGSGCAIGISRLIDLSYQHDEALEGWLGLKMHKRKQLLQKYKNDIIEEAMLYKINYLLQRGSSPDRQ